MILSSLLTSYKMNKSLFIDLTDPVIFQSFGGEEYWGKVEVPAGGFILKEGEESNDFYTIFSGSVKIVKSMKDSEHTQKYLATLGAGDFFGEGALLSDKSRNASVLALENTVLLKLSQEKFEQLVLKDPQAAVGIILGIVRVLNARLQSMDDRLVALEHVAHLSHKAHGNSAELIPLILKEITPVTHHGAFGFYSVDGQLRWSTAAATTEQLKVWGDNLSVVVSQLSAENSPASLEKDGQVYIPIHDLDGKLRGVLAVQFCTQCQDRDLYLLLTVAEQIGNLV